MQPTQAAFPQDINDDALVQLNAHLKALRSVENTNSLHDDVDAQLLPVFLEEAGELCPRIAGCLRALRDETIHDPHLLNRLLHTLKGSARMTGVMRIGDIAHAMEGRLLADGTDVDFRDALEADFNQINTLLEELHLFAAEVNHADEVDRRAVGTGVAERLYRTLRQTAKELGRRANLELIGFDAERDVPGKMTAPLEHLLRNAIVHGIEDEQLRIASGKEVIGEITLNLRRENNQLIFELSDDGRGLDLPALREQAIKKGLLDEADTSVNDDQLAQLIFIPGMSTAGEVTQVAGRGIGMDVVRSEIAELGGRISVSSKPGLGTQFTIHLPAPAVVNPVRER